VPRLRRQLFPFIAMVAWWHLVPITILIQPPLADVLRALGTSRNGSGKPDMSM
jgi:hypothetical protein